MKLHSLISLLLFAWISTIVQAKPPFVSPPTHPLKQMPAKWGAYTVTVGDKDGATQIYLWNQHHRVVREIDSGTCRAIYTQQINNKGLPELLVVAWNGSNVYCVHMTYIFTQDGGLRNIGIITGGEGVFQRLSRHGLQFVMASSGVLEDSLSMCHACEPDMPVVLDWHNGHASDAARKYPALFESMAKGYRTDFLQDRAKRANSESNWVIMSYAGGYYANEYELGHGRAAYRWIMHRLPTSSQREWFDASAKSVRDQISQIRHMTTISQAKVLSTPDSNVFTGLSK